MDIEDADGFKELKDVGLDYDAKGGKDAKGFGMGFFELDDGGEVVLSAGMEENVRMLLKDFFGKVG